MIFVKHDDEILKRKKKHLPEEENYQMTFPASPSSPSFLTQKRVEQWSHIFNTLFFFVEILLGHVF